jgi:hypothetical protein
MNSSPESSSTSTNAAAAEPAAPNCAEEDRRN